MRRLSPSLCAVVTLLAGHAASADDEDEGEFEVQEVLFLLEEAYTQEDAETQVGLSLDFGDGDDWSLEAEVEYGLSDRLQLVFEAPIETDDSGDAVFGDIEFGVDYAVLKDEGHGLAPELTFGMAFVAPTSSEESDWRLEPSARLSKMVTEGVFVHALVSGEYRLEGDDSEWEEWSAGAAAGWRPYGGWGFTVEYLREEEAENVMGVREWETEETAAFSIAFEFENELTIGAAIAQSVDGRGETRGIFKTQIEW